MNKVPTAEQLLADAAWLRRLALTLASDRDEADDLVQESWIAAWERQPTMERSLRPWLAKVVRDLAAMRRRSRQRREVREASVVATEPAAPDALLAQMRLHQLIVALVLELEEPFRATILARFVEGRAAAAIARSLGIPASTVRARQREGLARLRARLDERTGERKAWAPAALAFARKPVARPALPLVWLLFGGGLAILCATVIAVATQGRSARHATGATTAAASPVHARGTDRPATGQPLAWQAQPDAVERRIAGRVVVEGVPVPGAVVRLLSDPAVPATEQHTDRDGHFEFGACAPMAYSVGAAAAGRRAAIAHVDLRDPSTRADALELALGTCDAALFGRVTDPSGAPIAHAQLLREDVIGAESDATGAYELCGLANGLTSGELHIAIRAAGFAGSELVVGIPGRLQRDIVLVPEAVIEGLVTTAGGAPVRDARVEVARDAAVQPAGVELPAHLATTTDREGRFRLAGLAGGNQRITARARTGVASPVVVALRAGETRPVALRLDPTGTLEGRVIQHGKPTGGVRITAGERDAVSQADGSFVLEGVVGELHVVSEPRALSEVTAVVRAGERTAVAIELGPTGELHGTVRRHGIPAAGARVMVSRGDGDRGAYTDAGGRFVLARLDAGTYHGLSTAADGSAFATLAFSIAGDDAQELEVELASGARVTGTVGDAHGAPVAGVSLRFERPGGGTYDHGQCATDALGRFDCAGLAGGGTYTAQVFAIASGQAPFHFLASSQTSVDLTDGDSRVDGMRIAIDTTRATIRGHVRDSTGLAVADARITAFAGVTNNYGLVPSVVTDTEGAFAITDLAPGGYTLAVEAADGATTSAPALATGTSDVELTLDAVGCSPPHDVAPTFQPASRVVWDDRIELLGWDLPRRVKLGEPFTLVTYYKVLRPIDQPWKAFVHLQGKGWVNADHDPIDGRCPTTAWKAGDVLVDRVTTVVAKSPGDYHVWLGFFRGSPGTWQNLVLTAPPPGQRDADGRLDLATLSVD